MSVRLSLCNGSDWFVSKSLSTELPRPPKSWAAGWAKRRDGRNAIHPRKFHKVESTGGNAILDDAALASMIGGFWRLVNHILGRLPVSATIGITVLTLKVTWVVEGLGVL